MWKYLQITVTAGSLLVCVLLIGLWVRSYTLMYDVFAYTPSRYVLIMSDHGTIAIHLGTEIFRMKYGIEFGQETFDYLEESINYETVLPWFRSGLDDFGSPHIRVHTPHWFWLTITATIAALPWIKWHFSLRTLLIVMTLLALFFGAVAMSMRG
jgi:hypothetical protein